MSQRASLITLAVALLAGSALRLIGLERDSLWLDEAYSYVFAQLSWIELWRDLGRLDHNPPLYYSLLKIWGGATGWDEASMRLLSALASIATIPVAYGLGRSLASGDQSRAIAAGAAALVACHPVTVWSGGEVRSYALLTLALAIAFLCALRIMRSRNRSIRIWAALLLSMTLACWLHNLATTAVIWIGFAVFVWALSQTERRVQLIRRTMILGAGVVVLWLPALHQALSKAQEMTGGYWVRPVNAKRVLYMYTWELGPRLPMERIWIGLVLIGVVVGAVFLIRRHRARFEVILLAGALVVPAAIQIALSVWVVPLLIPRTLSWMVVPMAVLLAAACASLPNRALRVAVMLAVAGVYLAGSVEYGRGTHRNDWRGLVASVAERSSARDLVVLTPGPFEVAYAYYAEREGLKLPLVILPGVIAVTPKHTGPLRLTGCAGPEAGDLAVGSSECPIATWDGGVWFIAAGRPGREPESSIATAVSDGRQRTHYEERGRFLRASRYSAR